MTAWTIGHVVIDDVVLADGVRLDPVLGGAGSYAAVGQGLAGADRVLLASGVGADLPEQAWAVLAAAGISREAMPVLDPHTPRTELRYLADGERVETPQLGPEHFSKLDPTPSMLPSPVATDGIYYFGTPEPAWVDAASRWRAQGGTVLWEIHADAAATHERETVARLGAHVDVLSINRTEAAHLSGFADPEQALAGLRELTEATIVLRQGGEGAIVDDGSQRWRARPPGAPVVDPTGAGNAFSGAFVTALARTADLEIALRKAMAAAAVTLGQYGPPLVDEPLRERYAHLAASLDVATTRRTR